MQVSQMPHQWSRVQLLSRTLHQTLHLDFTASAVSSAEAEAEAILGQAVEVWWGLRMSLSDTVGDEKGVEEKEEEEEGVAGEEGLEEEEGVVEAVVASPGAEEEEGEEGSEALAFMVTMPVVCAHVAG